MDIVAILILFFSVLISASLLLLVKLSDKLVNALLFFSGAFLLSLAFTQIIPEIFHGPDSYYLGYFILLGFFIQIGIEYLSGGMDHGHHHAVEDVAHHTHSARFNPILLFVGISLHAFFEGVPFSGHFHAHEHAGNMLLWGIVVHKIPISIVLMSLLLSQGYSKIKSLIFISFFALTAPLGSVVSYFGGLYIANVEMYYHIIMAIVIGIFFHIATVILYEGDKSHKFNRFKFLVIILGILTAIGVGFLH